ncbi:NAD-dependent epimerase/dehydratase family protein [Microbacterium sp. SSM24]|uniref:NAD-dependent epimerase/dehydratase family protein n=1 Tax=Microbacterium sp. SSM24 TaxID=2991714 RepID=UPI002228010A|nr:NAD(P)-dependent oxidoreductase [Microbacterium sp. SSM24]MCW3492587.1 NAD(P)-dependent oxidoreductase [Microbacterium sp. SSM24]
MRIVVTGAAGRLGRSVVALLSERGHEVTGWDRVGSTSGLVRAVDVSDRPALDSAIQDAEPEAIIHLAGIAVPFSAPEDVIFATNTTLALNILHAAVEHAVSRVLLASSPTVVGYGEPGWTPAHLPLVESSPRAPRNAYALSKVCIEDMTEMFTRLHPKLRAATFRPCYVVTPEEWAGTPTQQGHTIVERLLRPELAAVSLFNYVDARDAAAFVDAWLRADDSPHGARYFVGAADSLSVESLSTLLPRSVPGTAVAAPSLHGSAAAFDCGAAYRDIGWKPTRSWRTELAAADLSAILPAVAAGDDSEGDAHGTDIR